MSTGGCPGPSEGRQLAAKGQAPSDSTQKSQVLWAHAETNPGQSSLRHGIGKDVSPSLTLVFRVFTNPVFKNLRLYTADPADPTERGPLNTPLSLP